MTTAVLTPTNATAGKPVAGRLWRKQVLPAGKQITYTDPTGASRTLNFDPAYLGEMVTAFNAGAYDTVKFQIADAKNTHTEDPERARGTVRALELTADGLDMIVDLTDDGAKLIGDHPDLPVSARIIEGLTRGDGKQFPAAIKHVLGTLDPRVPGMSPWQAVSDLATDDVPTVDLTAGDYTTAKKESRMSDVLAKIRKAFGLADSATEEEILAAAEAKLTPAEPESGDEETLSAEEIAALEALANEPAEASLTAEAQKQIDLANANAEQAVNRAKALEQQAARSAWAAERTERLHEGIPAAVLDLAAPWCGGDTPTGFIDLANTDTTVESVRDAAAADMRKMLDNFKGLIDLSVIGESSDPDTDAAEAKLRQERIKAHRQAAGI